MPSLIHLGVGYNALSDVTQIVTAFPSLFCLDISFNELESLQTVATELQSLTDLRMLFLVGNPVALTPKYREIVKQWFPRLKILDNIPTLNESDSPKKKKLKIVDTGLSVKQDIKDEMTLDLHFRVLYNIDGVYLNEETCPKVELLD